MKTEIEKLINEYEQEIVKLENEKLNTFDIDEDAYLYGRIEILQMVISDLNEKINLFK